MTQKFAVPLTLARVAHEAYALPNPAVALDDSTQQNASVNQSLRDLKSIWQNPEITRYGKKSALRAG